ncbi:MAG TPA: KEOPS complex kinase/ATPase Bud32 [Candidatus Bilamarchaeaceae archaeon]|nr:KEOPS complex kinase/ATPase Bud32 [Candidatus Bilamarchaeaceae archaeon]
MRGAEAELSLVRFLGKRMVRKERKAKAYREMELDLKIRLERTRREARLLHKAKAAGISAPTVYAVDDYSITMEYVRGRKLREDEMELREAGRLLASLHNAGIIHGDFTPYNIIVDGNGLHAIDFGLGFFSTRVEDKADDLITMLRAIRGKESFLSGYRECADFDAVLRRKVQIERRARYQ